MERSSRLLALVSRILFFLLIAVCLTSHLAARLPARFASGFSGDGGGRVAKFSGGTVYYETLNAALSGVDVSGYYAFVVSFRVEFDESEVSRKYSLAIEFDDDVAAGSSLIYPSGDVFLLTSGDADELDSYSQLGFSSGADRSLRRKRILFSCGGSNAERAERNVGNENSRAARDRRGAFDER